MPESQFLPSVIGAVSVFFQDLRIPFLLANLLILVVWAICSFGERRISPRVRCYLWRLTYVKLLIIAGVAAGIFQGVTWKLPDPPPVHVIEAYGPPPEAVAAQPELRSLPRRHYTVILPPRRLLWWTHQIVQPARIVVDANGVSYNIEGMSPMPWLESRWGAGITVALYLTGSLLLFVRMARSCYRARRLAATADTISEGAIHATLTHLAPRLGLRRAPRLARVRGLRSPLYTAGSILLPDAGLPAETEPLVLAHEAAHASRRDLFWEWLGMLAQMLFFYDPLVYLVRREERIARESAADAEALRVTGAAPAVYARMLLALSLSAPRPIPGAVGAIESGGILHRRLRALRQTSAAPRGAVGMAGVATIGGVEALLTVAALAPLSLSANALGEHVDWHHWIAAEDAFRIPPPNPREVAGSKCIAGTLHDFRGRPLAGGRLFISRVFGENWEPVKVRETRTTTDGHFAVSGLPMGDYEISAPYGIDAPADSDAPLKPWSIPGNPLYLLETRLYIPAAQRAPVFISLTAHETATILGRVMDRTTGKPIPGIVVDDAGPDNGFHASLSDAESVRQMPTTDADGRFMMHFNALGAIKLGAGIFDNGDNYAFACRVSPVKQSCFVREGANPVHLPDLVTDRLPVLRLVDDHGAPLSHASVALGHDAKSATPLANGNRRDTDASGYFRLSRATSGRFSVSPDGLTPLQGTYRVLPDESLRVTANGVTRTFANGIGVVQIPGRGLAEWNAPNQADRQR